MTAPAVTREQFDAEMASIGTEIARTGRELRRALLSGGDTAALRADLLALDERRARLHESLTSVLAEEERRSHAALDEIARQALRGALARIQARLDAIQPPQHPMGTAQ